MHNRNLFAFLIRSFPTAQMFLVFILNVTCLPVLHASVHVGLLPASLQARDMIFGGSQLTYKFLNLTKLRNTILSGQLKNADA